MRSQYLTVPRLQLNTEKIQVTECLNVLTIFVYLKHILNIDGDF